MDHANTVMTLRRKYAEIAGQLQANRHQGDELTADLAAISRTLRLLGDETEAAEISPIRPPVAGKWFHQGQCTRAVLDALRAAPEPLTIGELIEDVMRACGLRLDERRAVAATREAVKRVLKAQEDLIADDDGSPKRWRVVR
jgi:hypothetical protein